MVQLLQRRMTFLLCMLLLSACAASTRSSKPVAIPTVSEEDVDVATKQAHQTLNVLLTALSAPKPSYDYLGLKVRFNTPDGSFDDNWTEPLDYYQGIFTIRMLDGLTFDHNLHPDHVLDIPLHRVIDWMIVEKDGNLIGGFTIRLAYSHMTFDQRKEFLKITGYKIKE
jgi:hypothetical protein